MLYVDYKLRIPLLTPFNFGLQVDLDQIHVASYCLTASRASTNWTFDRFDDIRRRLRTGRGCHRTACRYTGRGIICTRACCYRGRRSDIGLPLSIHGCLIPVAWMAVQFRLALLSPTETGPYNRISEIAGLFVLLSNATSRTNLSQHRKKLPNETF